tara:strand:+ start:353 stop:532 length:180 start_codon:yes stop_codon:yes gene_type:complete
MLVIAFDLLEGEWIGSYPGMLIVSDKGLMARVMILLAEFNNIVPVLEASSMQAIIDQVC